MRKALLSWLKGQRPTRPKRTYVRRSDSIQAVERNEKGNRQRVRAPDAEPRGKKIEVGELVQDAVRDRGIRRCEELEACGALYALVQYQHDSVLRIRSKGTKQQPAPNGWRGS